jgi:hypothetical protein
MQKILQYIFFSFILAIISACGSKGGLKDVAKIELDPPELNVSIEKSNIPIGETGTYTITIRNVGSKDLNISDIACEYKPQTEEEQKQGDSFIFEKPSSFPVIISPEGGTGSYQKSFVISIKFKHYEDKVERNASCVIKSNAYGNEEVTLQFKTKESDAYIELPNLVDFGLAGADEKVEKEFSVLNMGSSRLNIFKFQMTGSKNFSITLEGKEYKVSEETIAGVTFNPYIVIDPNSSYKINSVFKPDSGEPAGAKLYFVNNAKNAVSGISTIELKGNTNGPCIKVSPSSVNFGGTQVGIKKLIKVQIESCGSSDLTIPDISLDEKSSKDFGFDFGFLPGEKAPTGTEPLILEPNAIAELGVFCQPDSINPKDAEGHPVPDEGDVLITNNTFSKTVKIHLLCVGVPNVCPLPAIIIDEGEEVKPQTLLHLHGEQSQAATGIIEEFLWKVEQPKENMQQFLPSAKVASPVFWANVAGKYIFTLDVIDSAGTCSCDEGCTNYKSEVLVIPEKAIHVELTWETQNDPDPYDSGHDAGSDMDLHFAHPFAASADIDGDGEPDPWFDKPWDCFWYEKTPNWGSFDPDTDDNPSLDRDDTDGAGPENLNLNIPEPGKTYRVGVHYWDDHGFGVSSAMVKIYIFQKPVAEYKCEGMKKLDLWKVAKIKWPDAKVEVWGKECNIVHNYQNPSFQPF